MNADNSFADGSWAMFNVANFVAGDSPSSGPGKKGYLVESVVERIVDTVLTAD